MTSRIFLLVISVFWLASSGFALDDTYHFSSEPIDVVIPCTKKDLETLELCIKGIKDNCRNVKRIIVVSEKPLTINAEWFNENHYPFSKYDIALALLQKKDRAENYLAHPQSRVGWYFQQLLKLYAPFVIPRISPNVLIVDADTVFLNPVEFLNEENAGLYNVDLMLHYPYFEHAAKLIPDFFRLFPQYSGVSHHMLMQRCVLEDLFRTVENKWKGEKFWKAFCYAVDKGQIHLSGASEYEIYFNFVFSQTDQVQLRLLKWDNSANLNLIDKFKADGYHYITFHAWMRGK